MTNIIRFVVALASLGAAAASAAEPAPPFIGYAFPAGAQRGATVQVTIGGQNLIGGDSVRVTGSGLTARVENVKDATSATLAITVAPDAPLGEREIRIVTPGGASNRFRFVVGRHPELNENEPNSVIGDAQPLESLPVVVNGQLMQADDDCFRFAAKAGRTIVCRVEARSLVPYIADAVPGWNDACLTLCDSGGREVVTVDDFRFHPDPVLIARIPRDGEYVLKIRDVLYRGRGDFVYRLSIGQLPHLTHVFPLGGRRDSTLPASLFGTNLPFDRLDVRLPTDATLHHVNVRSSNAMPLAVDDLREVRESEPDDAPTAADDVGAGFIVNGRIDAPGDIDRFSFRAEKGQTLVMELLARRLGSPVDGILTLFNAAGRKLAENDDTVDAAQSLVTHHADPRLQYTIAARGVYTLRLRDVQGKGGEAYAYRLRIAPPRPDFELRVTPDNPRLAPGDGAALTVTAIRRDGFAGPIDLSVAGLPEGYRTSATTISAGQTQASLTITAPTDTATTLLSPTVIGRATANDRELTRYAVPAEQVMQAFSYTHYIPTSELILSVIPSSAFSIASDRSPTDIVEVPQGGELPLTLTVTRQPGERGGIALKGVGLPKGVSIRPMFIPPDLDKATVTIAVSKQVPPGRHNVVVTATLKSGKDSALRTLPAVPLLVVSGKKP